MENKNKFPIVTFINNEGAQRLVQLCSASAALEYINDVVLRNGWQLLSVK